MSSFGIKINFERSWSRDRVVAYCILIVLVGFLFIGFYPEVFFTDIQFSDTAFHISILHQLDTAVRGGQNPLDFWFDGTPFGFALFRSYQYIPYLIMYGVYRLMGEYFSISQVLLGSSVLLIICFPISVFASCRLLQRGYIEAAITAVAASLISDGNEYGLGLQNYTFGTTGIITQLWAISFLPLAIAFSARWISLRKNLGWALLFGFLTFGSHVVAAVILAISIGVFSIYALITTNDRAALVKRAVTFAGLMIVVTAHQWWFVLADSKYINRSALEPAWKYNGRGVAYLVNLFWSGDLFDTARLPLLTALLLLGILIAFYDVGRSKSPSLISLRCILFIFCLFFSLCAGREIWGFLLNGIPVMANLHVHRFAVAVHLFGSMLIGIGGDFLYQKISKTTATTLLGVFLLFILIRPAILERRQMTRIAKARHDLSAQEFASDTDFQKILTAARKISGHGWLYTGSSTSWQSELLISEFIPVDLFTTLEGIPTIGGILYHAFSLSGDTLFDLSPYRPEHLDLYGITSIISPSEWQGDARFNRVMSIGRFALWTRASSRLFLGDGQFASSDNFFGQTDMMRQFVQRYKTPDIDPKNAVISSQSQDSSWHIDAKIRASKPQLVIAAHGFHPNWQVYIDDEKVATKWVTPGFLGFDVPAGDHRVMVQYEGSGLKKYLLGIALFVIVAGLIGSAHGKFNYGFENR